MLGRGEGGGRGSSKKGAVRLKRNYYFLFVHQVMFFSAWDVGMFEFCVS